MTIPEICERLERQADGLCKLEAGLQSLMDNIQTLRNQIGVGIPPQGAEVPYPPPHVPMDGPKNALSRY